MATVLHLKPLFRPPPVSAESPAQRRVRLGSRAAAWLFTGLFALSALILVTAIGVMLAYRGELVRIGPDNCYIGEGPPNSVAFGSLPLVHRLVYVVVAIVRATPILMIFWSLRALFGGYARGEVFSAGAARRFGRVGGWLCAYAVSPLLCHLALSATGYEIDKNWAHMASLQAFVLGLLVFVVGQVMQVGREIEEDREAFV
jgi:ABC-type amino acid transport system permease subunit